MRKLILVSLSIMFGTVNAQSLFFSEYAEGSSNNKYLEIYNPTEETIDLSGYAFPSVANDPSVPGEHEYWNTFDAGATIAPGDVYVIAHGSADPIILAFADQTHTYLSNGNDGYALVYGTETNYTAIDWIGNFDGDPGSSWPVCEDGTTQNHTLVRSLFVTQGNDWVVSSAPETCEWEVYDQDTWDYLGSHEGGSGGNAFPFVSAGEDQNAEPGMTITLDGSASSDSDGEIVSYLWEQISGVDIELSSEVDPVVTFIFPQVSVTTHLVFELTVTDNEGASSSDEVTISYYVFETMPIHDIQFTENMGDDCYASPYVDQSVSIIGIVTAVKPGSYPNFYIQDSNSESWNGVYVYDTTVMPIIGDEIQLTGSVTEYYGVTEITDIVAFNVVSTENEVSPTVVQTGDIGLTCSNTGEAYEGVLVELNFATIETIDEYGNWYVNDGSGTTKIDDYFFDGDWTTPETETEYGSIVGTVHYSYGEYVIYPRFASDIVEYTSNTLPTADAGSDQQVEPGVTVTLDGSTSSDPDGSIVEYEWIQTSGVMVTLSDEESDITTFTSPDESSELVFQLTVWDNDWNVSTDEVTITVVGLTLISDIQYTAEQGEYCYESEMVGSVVTTSGIVTHIKPGSNPNFFLQDPNEDSWSGIYVYDTSIAPSVGDEVVLTATVAEYYSLTQLTDVIASTIISSENTITPLPLFTSDVGIECNESGEMYESMLVSYSNITFESVDEFGNWTISDGTSTAMVDDYYFDGDDWPTISVGDTYGYLAGVISYSYGEFKLYPRNITDFTALDINDELEITGYELLNAYPNPFNPTTMISYNVPSEMKTLSVGVYNLHGQLVEMLVENQYQTSGYHQVVWNAQNQSSGVYFVKMITNNKIQTQKLMLIK